MEEFSRWFLSENDLLKLEYIPEFPSEPPQPPTASSSRGKSVKKITSLVKLIPSCWDQRTKHGWCYSVPGAHPVVLIEVETAASVKFTSFTIKFLLLEKKYIYHIELERVG